MKRSPPSPASFVAALVARGCPENVARNILRDARSAYRHGRHSMAGKRLHRVLAERGWRVQFGGAEAAVLFSQTERAAIPGVLPS